MPGDGLVACERFQGIVSRLQQSHPVGAFPLAADPRGAAWVDAAAPHDGVNVPGLWENASVPLIIIIALAPKNPVAGGEAAGGGARRGAGRARRGALRPANQRWSLLGNDLALRS